MHPYVLIWIRHASVYTHMSPYVHLFFRTHTFNTHLCQDSNKNKTENKNTVKLAKT